MPLTSMTGFGRSAGADGAVDWVWEVRTVNGRGLDLRLRLPPGYDSLEPRLREASGKVFSRGTVNATLTVQQTGGTARLKLNEAVLADVIAAVDTLRAHVGGDRPTAADLLAVRGLIEPVDSAIDEATQSRRNAAIAGGFEVALADVQRARRAEGSRLATVIGAHLATVERLVATVATAPVRSPDAIRARLAEQVARLLDAGGQAFDPARLHQEAVLLATRADVEEELQRLSSHIAAARDLLAAAEPVGRKFDFLTQEFNREANTLCSKANAPEITRAGLELKAVVDQMREQVQNIE